MTKKQELGPKPWAKVFGTAALALVLAGELQIDLASPTPISPTLPQVPPSPTPAPPDPARRQAVVELDDPDPSVGSPSSSAEPSSSSPPDASGAARTRRPATQRNIASPNSLLPPNEPAAPHGVASPTEAVPPASGLEVPFLPEPIRFDWISLGILLISLSLLVRVWRRRKNAASSRRGA